MPPAIRSSFPSVVWSRADEAKSLAQRAQQNLMRTMSAVRQTEAVAPASPAAQAAQRAYMEAQQTYTKVQNSSLAVQQGDSFVSMTKLKLESGILERITMGTQALASGAAAHQRLKQSSALYRPPAATPNGTTTASPTVSGVGNGRVYDCGLNIKALGAGDYGFSSSGKVEVYLSRSIKAFMLGDYSDESQTLLSLSGSLAAGIFDVDLPLDVRDAIYDLSHWNELEHPWRRIGIDAVAFIPVIGALKYTDEAADIIKRADDVADILDGAGDAARQLDNVGNAARQVDNVSDAAKVADDVGDAAHDVVRSGVLAQTQVDEILALPKGARPDPSTYLPDSYINSHLDEFEGGVTKIMSNAPTGTVGPPSGTFVMPKAVADELIEEAGGDVRKLENLLGLDPGALGDSPVRVDIDNPSGLRLPSGNESGANSNWIPGGFTSGGLPEAVIDRVQPGDYIYASIN